MRLGVGASLNRPCSPFGAPNDDVSLRLELRGWELGNGGKFAERARVLQPKFPSKFSHLERNDLTTLLSSKVPDMTPRPPAGTRVPSKSTKPKTDSKGFATASSKLKSKPAGKRPTPQQVKTKPGVHNPATPKKKKQRLYSDKELGLPTLNMITPAGVQKPKCKKKGKIFVDDRESMMTILAMVNAEKEGQIESKMMKARQMEEIREARRKEAEVRHEKKNEKLEETKKSFKKPTNSASTEKFKQASGKNEYAATVKSKKKVSFA